MKESKLVCKAQTEPEWLMKRCYPAVSASFNTDQVHSRTEFIDFPSFGLGQKVSRT